MAELEPIQARYGKLIRDTDYLDNVLAESVRNLRPLVDQTMQAVRHSIGMR